MSKPATLFADAPRTWICYHHDGQRLVPDREECPACGARNRPPWTQALSHEEAGQMLAAARKVGGEVERWAINVYYIQGALNDRVCRLERELDRTRRKWSNARRWRRDLRRALADEFDTSQRLRGALERYANEAPDHLKRIALDALGDA